ncbi:MAG: hypothetical protein ABFR95_01700 [Actinomycetota bacterium]
MNRGPWLGIGVGTLIAALGVWFGLFAIDSDRSVGLLILAVGLVFSMYAMAVFSGVEETANVAFNSAIYALTTATTLVIFFTVTQSPSYMVAVPVLALGVGGAIGLPPIGNRYRTLVRLGVAVLVTFIAILVYWVDHTVYALIAPLIPLPAIGLADRVFGLAREVVAE